MLDVVRDQARFRGESQTRPVAAMALSWMESMAEDRNYLAELKESRIHGK
jgi:hypothetical protein